MNEPHTGVFNVKFCLYMVRKLWLAQPVTGVALPPRVLIALPHSVSFIEQVLCPAVTP